MAVEEAVEPLIPMALRRPVRCRGLLPARWTHNLREILARAQDDIVGLMGQLSAGGENAARYAESGFRRVEPQAVDRLTAEGAALEGEFPDGFRTWSVPGAAGSAGGAWLEFARCVCRRAERAVAVLSASGARVDEVIPAWLNRLSDVLWLCARGEEKLSLDALS